MTYPYHMDFSKYSVSRLLRLADDDIALSHLDRDDVLQLVAAMADKLRGNEEDNE
jgi:hypothetical protein